MRKNGRFLATIKAAPGAAGTGEFEAVMSVPTLDRDGEVVDAKAFEPLPERITIDIDHAMSVEKTVASGVPFYDGDMLKVKGTFASTELGQNVRTLVTEGHIWQMSVAYMNAQYEDEDGVPHLRKGELLNAAIVGIPSNRESVITAAKSLQGITPGRSAKALAGSFEQRTEQLRESLRTANPSAGWLWVRATFDDSVVYDVESMDGTCTTWQAGYTLGDEGFTFDEPVEVDVAEVVVPPTKSTTLTDPDGSAAAKAAADRPADVQVAKARRELLAAEAALALL